MKPLGEGETCSCGFNPQNYMVESYHLTPGTILKDRYFIGSVLGEGGFGITYIGMDTVLERKIAVKEFFLSGYANRTNTVSMEIVTASGNKEKTYYNYLDKFLDEGKVMAKFGGNEGIVSIIDYFKLNNTAYIIMEFVEGETLKDYCKKNGSMNYDNMLEIMIPVMNALEQIHAQNYIHRDISPDNIMMTKKGSGKLLDFGAARNFDADGEKTLSVILKPGYAPEEQYRSKGKHGPWSDIYALCATMYFCLVGSAPSNSIERMVSDDVMAPHRLVPTCQPQYSNAIMKGMSVKWNDRYSSIAELRKALFEGEWNTANNAAPANENTSDKTMMLDQQNAQNTQNASITGYNTGFPQNNFGNQGQPQNYYSDTSQNGMTGFDQNYNNQYPQNDYNYNNNYNNNANYNNATEQQPKKSKALICLLVAIPLALVVIVGSLIAIGLSASDSDEEAVQKAIEAAEGFIDDKKYEEAIDEYNNALQLIEDDEDALAGRLDAYKKWINKELDDGKYEKAEKLLATAKKEYSDASLDKLAVKVYDAHLDDLSSQELFTEYEEIAQKAYDETGDEKYQDILDNMDDIAEGSEDAATVADAAEAAKGESGDPDFDATEAALEDVRPVIDEVAYKAYKGSLDDLHKYLAGSEFSKFLAKTSQIKSDVVYETPSGLIGIYHVESGIDHYAIYVGDFVNIGDERYIREGTGTYFIYNGNFAYYQGSWVDDSPNGYTTCDFYNTNGAYAYQWGMVIDGLWDGDVNMQYTDPSDGKVYSYTPNFTMGKLNAAGHTEDGLPIFAYCNENPNYYYYSQTKEHEFKTYGMPGFAELLL